MTTPVAPPRRKPRNDDPGARARILRAAMPEFAANGFHATSLRSITERAGSNKPMVYYHFEGKAGLYLATVEFVIDELGAAIAAATPVEDSIERLRRYARVYLEAFLAPGALSRTTLRELESLPADVRDAIVKHFDQDVVASLRNILVDGVKTGQFRDIPVNWCGSTIIWILNGLIRSSSPANPETIDAGVSQVVDFYAKGLLAKAVQ
jgi:TetR/AcrR family transcriptional regulator